MALFVAALRKNIFNFSRVLTEIRNISSESSFGSSNIPPCPKKPLPAFILFLQEKRNEMFEDRSKVSIQDQVKAISEKWRSLSDDEKQVYMKKHKEDLIIYAKLKEKYMDSLTENQRQELENELQTKKEKRQKRQFKSTLRKLNMPVQSKTAYGIFLSETAASNKGLSINDLSKKSSIEWKNMPEERKEIYRKRADNDKVRYLVEIEEWKSKMLNEGHGKVLNKLSKKNKPKKKT